MSKYVLNIKTGIVHNGINPCGQSKRTNKGNQKFFESYEDAVNFFEGKTLKGKPCGICLKDKDE